MNEMIERVARALCRRRTAMRGKNAEAWVEMHWRCYVPAARDAIKVMREPTAAMIEAEPDDYEGEYNKTNSVVAAQAYWRAMIDAALAGEK